MKAPLLPSNRQHRATAILPACAAICVTFAPAVGKIHSEWKSRHQASAEFKKSRAVVLEEIDRAVRQRDRDALQLIDRKYSSAVSDPAYHTAMAQAMSGVRASEARMELAVARSLSLTRHGEQVPFDAQELSQLPE